jgi:hypothetical protein
METTISLTTRLSELPLWRLIVALHDAERVAGSASPTARILAREINRRLNAHSPKPANEVRANG